MWVKHRAHLGFWGLIWHPEHERGLGGTQRVWGALGEPRGGFGVVAQSSFSQSWGGGGRGILALGLAGGKEGQMWTRE